METKHVALDKLLKGGNLCLCQSDAVPSEDVHQEILLRKISTSGGEEKEKHIAELQQLWQVSQLYGLVFLYCMVTRGVLKISCLCISYEHRRHFVFEDRTVGFSVLFAI